MLLFLAAKIIVIFTISDALASLRYIELKVTRPRYLLESIRRDEL